MFSSLRKGKGSSDAVKASSALTVVSLVQQNHKFEAWLRAKVDDLEARVAAQQARMSSRSEQEELEVWADFDDDEAVFDEADIDVGTATHIDESGDGDRQISTRPDSEAELLPEPLSPALADDPAPPDYFALMTSDDGDEGLSDDSPVSSEEPSIDLTSEPLLPAIEDETVLPATKDEVVLPAPVAVRDERGGNSVFLIESGYEPMLPVAQLVTPSSPVPASMPASEEEFAGSDTVIGNEVEVEAKMVVPASMPALKDDELAVDGGDTQQELMATWENWDESVLPDDNEGEWL